MDTTEPIYDKKSGYRWVILCAAASVMFVVTAMQYMCMPVLFHEMSVDTGISLAKLQILWAVIPLAGLLSCFPSGILADRYGSSMVVGLGSLCCAFFGGLRGISSSFSIMAVTTFLFGMFSYVPVVVLPKVMGEWFGEKEQGLAQGLIWSSYSAGAALALAISGTVISKAAGGWQNTYHFLGVLSLIVTLLWFLLTREKKESGTLEKSRSISTCEATAEGFKDNLLSVVGTKDVWLLVLVYAIFIGSYVGSCGVFPGLLEEWGWTASDAHLLMALVTVAGIIGCVIIPAFSDWIGLRRWVYSISVGAVGLITLFCFIFAQNPGALILWILFPAMGIFGGAMPIILAIPIEHKEISIALTGTVLGIMNTGTNISGFSYTLAGAYLLTVNPVYLGILFGIFGYLLSAVLMLSITETGRRK